MKVREYSDFLEDILESINLIDEFLAGYDAGNFINDRKTIFAVLWCLNVLGEAAKHIPASMREKFPEIPWEEMTGMRDKVVHAYFGINLDVVWDTAKQDLPQVKQLIKKALDEIDKLEEI